MRTRRDNSVSPVDDAVPRSVLARLTELCARMGARPGEPESVDSVLNALSPATERILDEHRGMANELIAAYEQLGVVFEVTRSLPGFQSESRVVTLFTDSLRRSSPERDVVAIRPDGEGGWCMPGALRADPDWLSGVLDRAVMNASSVVEQTPPPFAQGDAVEALACPVVSGDALVCVVVLMRPASLPEFRAVDMMLVDSLTTFCGDLIRNLRLLNEVRSLSIALVRALVSAVDQKDEYTCGHSLRVAYFADLLGRELGFSDDELQMLQWSALLHDVGKIGIRDSVLKKAGKLTDEEFDHIKEHPTRSAMVVRDIPQLADAMGGILHHHERYDGRGYPERLAGEGIPLQARVIQLADIFDALTSDRSYRTAYNWEQALDIIEKEAGTAVDPRLQPVFDKLMRTALSRDEEAWDRMLDRANSYTRADRPEPTDGEGI